MRIALAHPAMRSQVALTNGPIRLPSLVKATRRKDCETQLHAEDDLAEDEQLGGPAAAVERGYDDRRDDGEEAGDEAADPAGQPDFEEAFHDDLAGEGAGDGRVLAGGEEGQRKHGAGSGEAEQRGEELIGVADFGDFVMSLFVEDCSGDDQDRRVHEQGHHEGDGRVGLAHRIASRLPATVRG